MFERMWPERHEIPNDNLFNCQPQLRSVVVRSKTDLLGHGCRWGCRPRYLKTGLEKMDQKNERNAHWITKSEKAC